MRELVVDNFAGGGGTATGIKMAIGRSVDIAINHDPAAIAMHKANHPMTKHYCENVWEVDPKEATQGQPVALCWFSPDCKHFSKAKGGKPVDKSIRGLAWVAVKWAKAVKPRVIILENVEEFKTWGPLIPKRDKATGRILKKVYHSEDDDTAWHEAVSKEGETVPEELQIMMPDPERKGETFNQFVKALRKFGYKVDYRELRACDYGAPTIRKRFFLIARCDGKRIVWPEPSHADPNSLEVACGLKKPWIPASEIIDWSIPCPSIFSRKKPLADNTMQRIAKGIRKFVIDNPEPFIVQVNHSGANWDYCTSINKPLTTVTSKHGFGLVMPFLTQYHGYDSNARGQILNKPLLTIDASNRYGLITSHIIQLNHNSIGQPLTDPLNTITAGANHFGEVRAFLIKYYGTDVGQCLNTPLHTVTSKDRFGLVTIHGEDYQIVDIGMRMLTPRELFNAQGFPKDYIIDHDFAGNIYPKSAQVARCGNAVPPVFANALVRAELPELCGDSEYLVVNS